MTKKCIMTLAVAVLMVTTVQAADPVIKRDGDWPWAYKALDLCKIPVFMDVGHFVQLEKCNEREIILKQVPCGDIGKGGGDFPCYTGCEDFRIRANFPAIVGADLSGKVSWLKETKDYFLVGNEKKDTAQIQGTGSYEALKVCIDAWKTELFNAPGPDNKMKVADLTITVKPPDTE